MFNLVIFRSDQLEATTATQQSLGTSAGASPGTLTASSSRRSTWWEARLTPSWWRAGTTRSSRPAIILSTSRMIPRAATSSSLSESEGGLGFSLESSRRGLEAPYPRLLGGSVSGRKMRNSLPTSSPHSGLIRGLSASSVKKVGLTVNEGEMKFGETVLILQGSQGSYSGHRTGTRRTPSTISASLTGSLAGRSTL